jgi:carboxyl-terminal processing protease
MAVRSTRFGFPLLILAIASLIGGTFGQKLLADPSPGDAPLKTFAEVMTIVEDNYIGSSEPDEIIRGAISGMLGELDPHSNYLPPEAFGEMREEQRGNFSGLGIQINKRGPDQPLTIISPIDDTPADRAGLQAGDMIVLIEGQETVPMSVRDAVKLLKGDRNTKVTITVQRPGLNEPFDVTLLRDRIPIESLRFSYMLDDKTGIVRVANFTQTTADELDAAIIALKKKGMEQLILDLRGNPGGLLNQAVKVSERFLPAGDKIVFTRGRVPDSDEDFFAGNGGKRFDSPLVVLVDHSSASASEIVSGAIQDHDRGLVIGETTFGKGLVQRVIPLRNGGALAVTTAKYYTPSGRLIQRDYSDIDAYYFDRPEEEGTDGLGVTGDQPKEIPLEEREIFYTDSGRKVYGGGGVTPDYIIEPIKTKPFYGRLFRLNAFFDFSVKHANAHPDLKPDFRISS